MLRKEAATTPERLSVAQSPPRFIPASPSACAVHSDQATTANTPKALEAPVTLISEAIEQGADDSGWAHLGFVGSYLTKVQPDFDPRLYGSRKLSELLKKLPAAFETLERGTPGSPSRAVYARVVAQDARKRGD